MRKSHQDTAFAKKSLALLLRLGLRTVPLSEAALFRTVHWCHRGLTGYDATFVALAENLDARWLTADERGAAACGKKVALSLHAFTA